MIYPAVFVGRDAGGRVTEVRAAREGEARVSVVHCEVGQVTDAQELERMRREIARRLQDVVLATDDFRAMQAAVDRVVSELDTRARDLPAQRAELGEIQAFLQWLRDGAFVFLGYRAYDLTDEGGRVQVAVTPGSGLGVLRNEAISSYADGVPLESLDPGLRALV